MRFVICGLRFVGQGLGVRVWGSGFGGSRFGLGRLKQLGTDKHRAFRNRSTLEVFEEKDWDKRV